MSYVELSPSAAGGTAATTTFTPAGNVAATNVQAAIQELDTEKAPVSHIHSQSEVANLVSDLALKAPLASPVFTGDARAVTPTAGDNDTSIATTAFVTGAVTTGVTGMVRYDTAQSLTVNQRAQARANIDVTKKNYIINGAMMVSQENGTTTAATNGYYGADQFFSNITGTTGLITFGQAVSMTPAGSPNRIRATVTTPDAAVAAGDIVWIEHRIEGLRVVDLRSGFASAKTVTLQFGVKAPAGTYSVTILNGATTRSYVGEYVIAAGEANTDVVKSLTVTLDTTGSWAIDNTAGLVFRFALMAGSTYARAAGSWSGTNMVGSTSQFNFMGTNGNIFELFDVSLTEGTVAPPFVVPDYASELAACRRYWKTNHDVLGHWHETDATTLIVSVAHDPNMRTVPTVAVRLTANRASRPGLGNYNIGASPLGGYVNAANGTTVALNTAMAVVNVPGLLAVDSLSFSARL